MQQQQRFQLSQQQHAKALLDAQFYTLQQLKRFYLNASIGFRCASLASWVLVSFFVGQFFAGAEFETLGEWRTIQYVYAVMGILLATALTFAEVVLFNSGRTREYWLVALFAVGFSVFAESAATMQREQVAVSFKSAQSPTYQAALKAVDTLAQAPTLSSVQVQLGYAQADLAQARQVGNMATIASLQARVNRLQYQADLEQGNRTALLSATLQQAKQMEYDETKHQAMIRFMVENFKVSHVTASALLAFFLILTFKLCFHYLGAMRQRNDRAIGISTGTISIVLPTTSLLSGTVNTVKNSTETATLPPIENQSLSTVNTAYMQSDSDLYKAFLAALKRGEVGLSHRDMSDWVKANATGKTALYDLAKVGQELLELAEREGHLVLNPEYVKGNRKPKYIIV